MTDLLKIVDILITLTAFMIAGGLIRPWWVLWFMYMQNRKMVLKYYGSVLIILLLIKLLGPVFFDN